MRLGRIQNDFSAAGFDLVKAQGLEFIEICCNYDEHVHRLIDAKESIKKEIARTGIDVSSVGRWNNNIQENGVIVPERLSLYLELMETAIELGAKVFVVGCNRDKSISLYRNYENAVSFFRTLIERADGRIKVAVEHCDWNNFITSPKQWEIVLDELPELSSNTTPRHTATAVRITSPPSRIGLTAWPTCTSRAWFAQARTPWTIRPQAWTTSTGPRSLPFCIAEATTAT